MQGETQQPADKGATPQAPGSPVGEDIWLFDSARHMLAGVNLRRIRSFSSLGSPSGSPHTSMIFGETPLFLRHGLASIQGLPPQILLRLELTPCIDYNFFSSGNRRTQEDAHTTVPELLRAPKDKTLKRDAEAFPFAFFGIYDGHGGNLPHNLFVNRAANRAKWTHKYQCYFNRGNGFRIYLPESARSLCRRASKM